MKSLDVFGVCNGIVDIFSDITESDFSGLGFEKGTMRLVEPADQQALLLQGQGPGQTQRRGGSSRCRAVHLSAIVSRSVEMQEVT